MSVNWTMVGALATALYGVAFVVSIVFLLRQLRQQESKETGHETTDDCPCR